MHVSAPWLTNVVLLWSQVVPDFTPGKREPPYWCSCGNGLLWCQPGIFPQQHLLGPKLNQCGWVCFGLIFNIFVFLLLFFLYFILHCRDMCKYISNSTAKLAPYFHPPDKFVLFYLTIKTNILLVKSSSFFCAFICRNFLQNLKKNVWLFHFLHKLTSPNKHTHQYNTLFHTQIKAQDHKLDRSLCQQNHIDKNRNALFLKLFFF